MATDKNESVSFGITPEFQSLLEPAAVHERRGQTNLLERLLFDHCKQGITAPVVSKSVVHERVGA